MHGDAQQLAQWRAQLAREEEDSDDDGLHGYGADDVHVPGDHDLGLALEDLPLPRAAPLPRRAGQAPTGPPRPHLSTGGEEANVLMHKMQVLQLKLEEREIELESARQQLGTPAASSALPDAREAKMKELAKRAKAATMALGRERATTAQLKAELTQLKRERDGGAAGPSGGSGVGGGAGGSAGGGAAARLESAAARVSDAREGLDSAALERELKETKERLAGANTRLHEAKVTGQSTKAELAKYQRALAREVGEDMQVAKLLDDSSGAKGRAQQIALLKEQLKTLTRKLANADGDEGVPGSPNTAAERQRGALQAIEQERRRELERLLLREQELSAEVVEGRKKADAMAARIRNLEGDVKSKKDKLKTLLDKSDCDDQLVAALRGELDKLHKGGVGSAPKGSAGGVAESELATQKRRMSELASRAAQQQTQIDRQEQIILALRDQLQRQQENGGGGASVRPPQDLIALQTENGKLRELVALLQEKLNEAEAY